MISPKPLTDNLSVCSFITPADLPQLAGRFGTIINARPDGEEPGQPDSVALAEAARGLGIEYVHIPVIPGQISDDQAAAFGRAMAEKPRPILAYCKSGARAASLWALSSVGEYGVERVLAATAGAGFDLAALKPRLESKARA